MTDCVFCAIGAGRLPATVVAETPRALAFRDLNPAAPIHVLLIPKEHLADSAAQPVAGDLWAELLDLARMVADHDHLDDGWRLVTNVGRDGGQTVQHLHLHLLGGRRMTWPPG